MRRLARTRWMTCSAQVNERSKLRYRPFQHLEEETMSQPDEDSIIISEEGEHDGKTVILQRCPVHDIVFLPSEGCPECAKEQEAAGG